jgi:hypothetical protein
LEIGRTTPRFVEALPPTAHLNQTPAPLEASTRLPAPTGGAARSLRRLEVFLDVVYGLIAVQMLSYLPPVKDMSWAGKPLGLLSPLVGNARELWRAVMGIGITAIGWCVSARRLSHLGTTDVVHTTIVLLQTGFVCLFIYFAICDPTLTGGPSSRALQCGSVALASACGQLAWIYARRRGLMDDGAAASDLDDIGSRGRTETATAVLNTPLSWVGPLSWTVGWVIIPIVITQLLPRLRARRTVVPPRAPDASPPRATNQFVEP